MARILDVAFSPDGRVLASASQDQSVKLWDVATGTETATLSGHKGQFTDLAFGPDGRILASANKYGTVKLWDVATGKESATLRGHKSHVDAGAGETPALIFSVTFSPDGRMLASASDDQTIKLWDVASSKEIITLRGHGGAVKSVSFSPDGRTLASASSDGTVKLWNLVTGQATATLRGHTSGVDSVIFSSDGRTLVSIGADKRVKLWDVGAGEVLLRGHKEDVRSVAFSKDNLKLRTTDKSGTTLFWDVRTGKQLLYTPQVPFVDSTDKKPELWHPDDELNNLPVPIDLPEPDIQESDLLVGGTLIYYRSPNGRWQAIIDGPIVRLYDLNLLGRETKRKTYLDRRDREVLFWHQERAHKAKEAKWWFAYAFHVSKLSHVQPWNANVLREQVLAWEKAKQPHHAALAAVLLTLNEQNRWFRLIESTSQPPEIRDPLQLPKKAKTPAP